MGLHKDTPPPKYVPFFMKLEVLRPEVKYRYVVKVNNEFRAVPEGSRQTHRNLTLENNRKNPKGVTGEVLVTDAGELVKTERAFHIYASVPDDVAFAGLENVTDEVERVSIFKGIRVNTAQLIADQTRLPVKLDMFYKGNGSTETIDIQPSKARPE